MDCKVLVLGAGGLGCEILKNLIMCNVASVHIIDMDTIELTNLNRQFLFTDSDVGKPKATTATNYIQSHFPQLTTKLTPIVADLTLLSTTFYEQFDFILSGLDAIKPRRFMNETIIKITRSTNFAKVIPFIDGGTEGLKGHVKTIIPGFTACWECSINTLPKNEDTLPICTIINNPRKLEHVIEYVVTTVYPLDSIEWQNDENSSQLLQDILAACEKRAEEFGIDARELTTSYILGIIKKIIPSVSATNAIIAACTCNELIKIYHDLIEIDNDGNIQTNNFTVLNGADGCFSYSFKYQRLPDCPACSVL